jgi:integrase
MLQARRTQSEAKSGHELGLPKSGNGRSIEPSKKVAEALMIPPREACGENVRLPVARGRPRVSDDDGHDHERDEPAGAPLQAAAEGRGSSRRPAPSPRHTCATILLMAGKHPKYVEELLGHASMSITLDTYSHVIEGMDGGLGDAMDEAL